MVDFPRHLFFFIRISLPRSEQESNIELFQFHNMINGMGLESLYKEYFIGLSLEVGGIRILIIVLLQQHGMRLLFVNCTFSTKRISNSKISKISLNTQSSKCISFNMNVKWIQFHLKFDF